MTAQTSGRMLASPVSIASAEHYAWGQGCDGWHLVKQDSLSVIEEKMPAGTAEERHRHATARQFFYVLSGALTFEMEGLTHVLAAGSGIEVPPGAVHTAANAGPEEARFLLVSVPPARGDRETA